jgi:hypothetical protein
VSIVENMEKGLKKSNVTQTENGAKAYISTGDKVLDLFTKGGTSRTVDETELRQTFLEAYNEDKELTLKCLFFIRDIREGLGEREVFRKMLKMIPKDDLEKLPVAELILEYGRFDDILVLIDDDMSFETQNYALSEIKKCYDVMIGYKDEI